MEVGRPGRADSGDVPDGIRVADSPGEQIGTAFAGTVADSTPPFKEAGRPGGTARLPDSVFISPVNTLPDSGNKAPGQTRLTAGAILRPERLRNSCCRAKQGWSIYM